MQPLHRSAKPLILRTLGDKGALIGQLLADWALIAGEELAGMATPQDVSFQKNSETGARLTLQCRSADAPELSMQLPLLQEKIKRHFGYALVERIVLQHR